MSAVPGPPAPDPESMDILATAAMDAQRRGFERLCLICLQGFNGATCPRCPLTSGPPAPDPRDALSKIRFLLSTKSRLVFTRRVWEEEVFEGDTYAFRPDDMAEIKRLADEAGAAVSAPPAGLTVERLAALLREWSEDSDELQAGEEQLYTDDEWAAALATWLAPRLSVSPGAPPAARLAPTDAMIAAARDVILELRRALENPVPQPTWRLAALCDAGLATLEREALRAALAAQESP